MTNQDVVTPLRAQRPVAHDRVPHHRHTRAPGTTEADSPGGAPDVVLVHDYLTQRGGAERVVLEMTRQFPAAPLLTAFYEPSTTYAEFTGANVRAGALSRVKLFRKDPRLAFPLLAWMYSTRRMPDGVILVSSSGWAHGVRTKGPKVVYCHNPARWLYQPDDYFARFPRVARRGIARLLAPLRAWDKRAARTATSYLANSTIVAERIEAAYGISATVVHPPSSLRADGAQQPIEGLEPGFMLTIGRRRGYKNTELVCEAAALAGRRLVVVGGLPHRTGGWPLHINGLTDISDAQLRWLYAHCDAVVAMSREDFGLTPIEGFSFGKPCIALRAGGYLDSCVEGVTGTFVDVPDPRVLAATLRSFDSGRFAASTIRTHAGRFAPSAFGERLRAAVSVAVHQHGDSRPIGSADAPVPLPLDLSRHGRRGMGCPPPTEVRSASHIA